MLSYNPLAINANSSQFQPISLDPGNGYCKAIFGGNESTIPSLTKQVNHRDFEYGSTSQGCFMEYAGGDRTDLTNTRWLIGHPAYIEFPDSHTRICDERQNKAAYVFQLLCGALSQLPLQPRMNLAIACSTHDTDTFSDSIKGNLNGSHSLIVNGQALDLTIKALVLNEGVGAIACAINSGIVTRDSNTIQLDIGQGTTIVTAFNGLNAIKSSRYIHSNGTQRLIQMICDHPQLRKQLGGISANPELIRRGINTGTFYYGNMAINFRDIYQEELPNWVMEVIAPSYKKIEPWLASADKVLAVGGGAQLPGIVSILSKKRIHIVPNAQMANCLGMLSIVKQKLGA